MKRTPIPASLFSTLAVFALWIAFAAPASAQNYNCGTPQQNHCYGVTAWSQTGEYFGAYSDITVGNLNCPSGCGGFVDDEMWLSDYNSANCQSNQFGACWVEAGYLTSDGGSQVYFWADAREGNGNTFNLHLLGGVDPTGTEDHYMIVKDGRSNPNNYLVFIYNDSQSTLYNGTNVPTNPGQMTPHNILIGQELAGSNNASATEVNFCRNRWATSALDGSYTFFASSQTTQGNVRSDKPPTASWLEVPGSMGAPDGGIFQTNCCGT